MGADTMRLLATIPELAGWEGGQRTPPGREPDGAASSADPIPQHPLPAVAAPETDGEAVPVEPAAPKARPTRRPARTSFPWTSVALLAAVAFVAWAMAGWNDARRSARQRAEERWASLLEPADGPEERVIR